MTKGEETLYSRVTRERREGKKAAIGYYDLERSIGEGNFAKVKLATHTLTGAKVLFFFFHILNLIQFNNFIIKKRLQLKLLIRQRYFLLLFLLLFLHSLMIIIICFCI